MGVGDKTKGDKKVVETVHKGTPATTDIATEVIHPFKVVCTETMDDPNTQHEIAS